MVRIFMYAVVYILSLLASYAQVKSEDIIVYNDSIELPGELSYFKKETPLVIWIHGSGNVDRNGNQGAIVKANYIQQFRELLIQHEIAFFSYDKRTSNSKNYKHLKGIQFEDLVIDAQKVVEALLKKRKFSKVILLGHSQGSLVGMLALNKQIDKYISLSGPAYAIDETLIKQIAKNSPSLATTVTDHVKELKSKGEIKEVHPMLVSIFAKQNQPFLKSWMKYNPAEEIKKVTIPLLIVNGTKDIQVASEEAKILHQSNINSELLLIDNMNHVIKEIIKDEDNLLSYYSPDFKISKKLINEVVKFIKK